MPLDELEFPGTVPFLKLLFAHDCRGHVLMHLKIHQGVYPVRLGESFDQAMFVLPNTFPQIAGDADVQRAVAFTGKDVYRRLPLNHEYLPGFPLARE